MHRILLTALLLGSVAGCALRPRYSDFINPKTTGPETTFLLTTNTGQPLANVRVEMSEARNRYTTTTGADGTFCLPVDKKYLTEDPVLVVTLPAGATGYRMTLAPGAANTSRSDACTRPGFNREGLVMLGLILIVFLAAAPTPAKEQQVFHGWSKDGSWLAYEVHGANELVELFFCQSSPEVRPTWPASLHELEREETSRLSCVHLMDPNKAPWQWKNQLTLPTPSFKAGGVEVQHELSMDGDSPGFVLLAGEKKQVCYASGVREDSKLQKTWFHASGRYVAALIDGNFHHCLVTVKPTAVAKPSRKH